MVFASNCEQLGDLCLPAGMLGGHGYLLKSKNVLIEVVLDLFIGDVDAQLLEGIPLKILEPKDIQDPHVHAVICETA